MFRWLALAALLFVSPAWAQSTLLQGGAVTAGHVPVYVSNGSAQPVVTDSGTAAGGSSGVGLKELGLTVRSTGTAPYANAGTGPNGENICDYDGPTTGAYHYLCMSPNAQGGALISTGAAGGASNQPLQFMVNGIIQSFASTSGYTAGDVTCFDTISTSIIPCPTQPGTMYQQNASAVAITGGTIAGTTITGGTISSLGSPLGVASGGTGVTSLPALSTAMGLGTMSTQNANSVAISGGAITGMPSPTNGSDVATKTYVDATTVGLTPIAASKLITITTLAANTYNNGTAGVGATLTGNSNGALTIDSVAVVNNDVVVVNNESTASHNGIYKQTQLGDGSHPYILTRVTYFDQAVEMIKNTYTSVTAGATEAGTSWILSAAVATVGTDPVSFTLFSSSALTTLANGTIYVGNSSNVATSQTLSGDCTMTNAAVITCTKTSGSDFATSATTDTTVATNISSGTLPAARLPNPTSGTLGGVQSIATVSHQFLTGISTSGVPSQAQPAFTDVSGTATAAQGGTGQSSYTTGDLPYASGSTAISKLGIGSTGQVLTVVGGLPAWGTISSGGSTQNIYTATGTATWTKPGSGTVAYVQCWGAGGGGGNAGSSSTGGGGGAYVDHLFPLSALTATVTVTVGVGGNATVAGGNSSFGAYLVGYSGSGGASGVTTGTGGGQGSAASGLTPGKDLGGGTTAGFAGGGSQGSSVYGGGGGAGQNPGSAGGGSGYGGGGGGGNGSGAGGVSIYGGSGGTNGAGAQPGGGGAAINGTGSKGGDGECIVTVW